MEEWFPYVKLTFFTFTLPLTKQLFRRKERQRIDLNADIFFSSPPGDPSTVTGGQQQQHQQQQQQEGEEFEEGGGEADTVAPSARQISKQRRRKSLSRGKRGNCY